MVFQNIIDLNFALLGYSESEPSAYWNNALTNKILTKDELLEIEKIYLKLKRRPTIYFENKPELANLVQFVKSQGYEKRFEDSWMFHNGDNINENGFEKVKKVETEKDLKIFIETFYNSYLKDDPQNPYGDQTSYLSLLEKSWLINHKDDSIECFVVFENDKPVAVSALNNYGKIGYISNVGSLKNVRGEGFGKLATLYCVWASKQKGHKMHVLGTEEGTYPNEFYKRIGFATKFKALAYSK